MMVGYGYRRDPEELRKAGAERVWVDFTPGRYERADMMRDGGLRPGDTLILFSLRDLGGSPVADRKWEARIAERGASIKIVRPLVEPKRVGAPRKYDPDAASARRHYAIWIDGTRSERDRLAAIAADYGAPVTRQTLNGRYGNPSNPKQAPE